MDNLDTSLQLVVGGQAIVGTVTGTVAIVTWLARLLNVGGRGKMLLTTICAAYLVGTVMLTAVAPVAAVIAAAVYYTTVVATLADAQFTSSRQHALDGSRQSD